MTNEDLTFFLDYQIKQTEDEINNLLHQMTDYHCGTPTETEYDDLRRKIDYLRDLYEQVDKMTDQALKTR